MKHWSSVFMLQNVQFWKLSKDRYSCLNLVLFGCDVQVQVTPQW